MKTIVITGATDGIGLETAKMLAKEGHHIIVHGRSESKLTALQNVLKDEFPQSNIDTVQADLSLFDEVSKLSNDIKQKATHIDVLINNAGVFAMSDPKTVSGLDARFMVNTIAPYMLTMALKDNMSAQSRVVNVSSAAQAPVNFAALRGEVSLSDGAAYAQSKLAITMWTKFLGQRFKESGPRMVSVNPKSLLGSKMVKTAYGIAGGDLKLGAKIFVEAALSSRFANVSGEYFDNDHEMFAPPHPYANDAAHLATLIDEMDSIIASNT
jgi:short-subunit dehydrogenase